MILIWNPWFHTIYGSRILRLVFSSSGTIQQPKLKKNGRRYSATLKNFKTYRVSSGKGSIRPKYVLHPKYVWLWDPDWSNFPLPNLFEWIKHIFGPVGPFSDVWNYLSLSGTYVGRSDELFCYRTVSNGWKTYLGLIRPATLILIVLVYLNPVGKYCGRTNQIFRYETFSNACIWAVWGTFPTFAMT
jgi:hypothetical protein